MLFSKQTKLTENEKQFENLFISGLEPKFARFLWELLSLRQAESQSKTCLRMQISHREMSVEPLLFRLPWSSCYHLHWTKDNLTQTYISSSFKFSSISLLVHQKHLSPSATEIMDNVVSESDILLVQ